MSQDLLESLRKKLHTKIDELIEEAKASFMNTTSQRPSPGAESNSDLERLEWQKSHHGNYEYLFPNRVPEEMKESLRSGKRQVGNYVLYMTKNGSVRRYPIAKKG